MNPILILRSLLFALGQTISLVVISVLGQLTLPFSHKARYRVMTQWATFCLWWLRLTCGIKVRVHGAELIQPEKAGLILARHESAWETLQLQRIFPRQAFVLKEELLRIPFFGWGMRLLHPIAIDRGAGRKALKQILQEGQARLDDGIWVVIFPEGTRMPPNELGKINIGAAMLAKQAQVPVYLVAHNGGHFWPKNSFMKRPGTVDLYIKRIDDVSALSTAEINQLTAEWYQQHFSAPSIAESLDAQPGGHE
ncbi:1-acyl-sn-glycerol-3-phosphate acyltransferase [Thiosulfatimonas sediminis]|uniref:1-acyl-sn-glycerol-3-phosphate acyltransferase n=1 Tax=Thiosulfatimonas sediminis TaxID=2675054 RepID=A0A6F8PS77_9GAMM|nr:lysophospholipid acyltransferase family protein [Thiosulfatimonas sediminis]BBP44981.1 1-acyl-sn-glycerol-3-phosphate acyltransferase [Thiosulfatimonas sediminis]